MAEEQDKIYFVKDLTVPETPPAGKEPEPWSQMSIVGRPLPRVDGYERVSGTAVYPSDVQLPGMIYGAILGCPHPSARVKSVDASAAEKMPGVRAVLTGSSPEAAGVEWPYSKTMKTNLFDPICRFEGEAVAAVAAETPYQAADALRAIKVDYEVLPFVADERDALADGAPKVHETGNLAMEPVTYTRGDVAKGFTEADAVVEKSFRTEAEIHTPMELHGCVANWEVDRLNIWESTQGVYAVQAKTAEVLGLPLSKVRVIGRFMGGGFGSKLQPGKYTVIAALLARKAGRPVKLFLSREETFLCVGNRPPANMTLKAGVKKDGTLTAFEFTDLGTGGAFQSGGTSLVDWMVKDLYTCPNVKTTMADVFINAGPARPFRAPGMPQGAWALEQVMDELALAIGMDPVDLRLKNIPTVSQGRDGSPPYTTTGLRECIEKGAEAFGWKAARKKAETMREGNRRRGVGMAAALWFVGGGGPPSTAIVKLFADGSVNLNIGASDIGTGTKTVMALVVSEELGVRPEVVQIENADTGVTQFATPSGGSKTVPTEAPAVRAAALDVKRQLIEMAAVDLGEKPENLVYDGDDVISKTDKTKNIKVKDVTMLQKRGVVVGVGYRGPNPEGKTVNPFAAQFCEVEVDVKTGEVQILRFLGANESGRVMNRLTFDSQVYGGITMGIGLAATEMRVLDRKGTGKLCNRNWHDYKVPTALDVPADMVSLPIDLPDAEANLVGAKGLGEPVTIPTAPAIANAIHHAAGIRVQDTPANPVSLCALLSQTKEA